MTTIYQIICRFYGWNRFDIRNQIPHPIQLTTPPLIIIITHSMSINPCIMILITYLFCNYLEKKSVRRHAYTATCCHRRCTKGSTKIITKEDLLQDFEFEYDDKVQKGLISYSNCTLSRYHLGLNKTYEYEI